MADGVAIGTFDKPTGAAPVDFSVSALGFTPKFVMLWSTIETAEGFSASARFALGAASGTAQANMRSLGCWIEDNVATTNTARSVDSDLLAMLQLGFTGSYDFKCQLKSFDSGGFTVTFDNNTDAAADKIHYIAIGGSDLTNVAVVEETLPTTTGVNDFTGLGFQPDLFMILFPNVATAIDNGVVAAKFGIGAGISDTKRWASALNARDAQTMTALVDAMKEQKTVACMLGLSDTATAEVEVDVSARSAWPATGIRLNTITAPPGTRIFFVIGFKGGSWDLGVTNKTTSAAPVDQAIISGLGFTPNGFFFSSYCAVAGTTIIADSEVAIGSGLSSTKELSAWISENDATLNTQADRSIKSDKCFMIGDEAATPTIGSEADFKQIDSGGCTWTWTTNDTAVSEQICWIAARVTDAVAVDLPYQPFYQRSPILAQ